MAIPALAQEPVLKNYTAKDGLPSQEVFDVFKDKKGHIWVCTDAGIAKYNANNFKVFNSSSGLPDNTVFEVKEDVKGRIWFRTYSGKLGYIFEDTVVVIGANEKIRAFQKEGVICSFAIDKKGSVYLGTQNTQAISFLKIVPPYGADNTEIIWKDTLQELGISLVLIEDDKIVYSEKRLKHFPVIINGRVPFFEFNIFDNQHKRLMSDSAFIERSVLPFTRFLKKGLTLYSANGKSLNVYRLQDKKTERYTSVENILTLFDEGEKFWLGFRNNGFACVTDKSDTVRYKQDYTVSGFAKDINGGYWIGTLDKGLFYMPLQQYTKIDLRDVFSKLDLLFYEKISDSALIACMHEEVYYLKLNKNGIWQKEKILPGIKTGHIHYLLKIEANKMLIAGEKGCLLYETRKKKVIGEFNRAQLSSYKKMMLYKGHYAAFITKDLDLLDTISFKIMDEIKCVDRILSMEYNRNTDELFVGGLHGLYKYTGNKTIGDNDRLLNCRVEDLKIKGPLLFIATKDFGLIVKNNKVYDTINEKLGLLSDVSKSLQLDDEGIWLVSNKGLSFINYQGFRKYTIMNFPLPVFMGPASVNNPVRMGDKIMFSSNSGIYAFPYKQQQNANLFYITGFFANEIQKEHKNRIVLGYNENNVRVNYEALFFSNHGKIQYRYKLSGLDSAWRYTLESNISFPSLSPGTYTIVLEAKNSSGTWIESDRKLFFKIEKPFWQKWWFVLVEIVLGIALISFLIIFRYRTIYKKDLEKARLQNLMYELEVKAVKAQMNPHFIFNSLNSIQEFVLKNDSKNAYSYLTRFSMLVRKILESNTAKSISVSDELKILAGYLEMEALRFGNIFNYKISIDEDIKAGNFNIPHMMVQPFVENAIWHGLLHKTGEKNVEISFQYLDKTRIKCIIEDNGIGRDAFKKDDFIADKKSLGMDFIKQRLDLYAKTLNVDCGIEITDKKNEDGVSEGTKVIIIIPFLI